MWTRFLISAKGSSRPGGGAGRAVVSRSCSSISASSSSHAAACGAHRELHLGASHCYCESETSRRGRGRPASILAPQCRQAHLGPIVDPPVGGTPLPVTDRLSPLLNRVWRGRSVSPR